MVKGRADLHLRFKRVPYIVKRELREQLEKEASKIVAEMNSIKPIPNILIDWTWGDAPEGSLTIGKVKGREFGKVSITIYATAFTKDYPDGFPAVAKWFEFGTSERISRSGKTSGLIVANPYFWPVFRANKRRVKSNLSSAVRRAMKKA